MDLCEYIYIQTGLKSRWRWNFATSPLVQSTLCVLGRPPKIKLLLHENYVLDPTLFGVGDSR